MQPSNYNSLAGTAPLLPEPKYTRIRTSLTIVFGYPTGSEKAMLSDRQGLGSGMHQDVYDVNFCLICPCFSLLPFNNHQISSKIDFFPPRIIPLTYDILYINNFIVIIVVYIHSSSKYMYTYYHYVYFTLFVYILLLYPNPEAPVIQVPYPKLYSKLVVYIQNLVCIQIRSIYTLFYYYSVFILLIFRIIYEKYKRAKTPYPFRLPSLSFALCRIKGVNINVPHIQFALRTLLRRHLSFPLILDTSVANDISSPDATVQRDLKPTLKGVQS